MTDRIKNNQIIDEGYGSFPIEAVKDLNVSSTDLIPEITPRLSVMTSKILNQQALQKYDTSPVPEISTPTSTPLRKWNTEKVLNMPRNAGIPKKSYSNADIGIKRESDLGKMNPLRKWRETHLATSEDLSLKEEDEEEFSSNKLNISGASTPQQDTDSESGDETDRASMGKNTSETIPQAGPSTSPNPPKKGLFRFLKSLSQDSKLPKLGSNSFASKIPKPVVQLKKPDSPILNAKVPLLSKLYKLSKREPPLPKLDFKNLNLFDNQEPDEFTDDLEAKKEIQRFLKKYSILKQIGIGGHSTVRLANRIPDSTKVVAKFIHSSNVWQWHNTASDRLPLEIVMMKTFANLNVTSVIRYFEHYKIGQRYIIIMEYLGDNWIDLYDYIELYGPVKEHTSRKIFKKVVKVISDMHVLGFSHNDVKDENVMINKQTLDIKLIDFGSTFPLSKEPATTFYGTQKFSAPEALYGNPYILEEQEVWALGTLLYVLLFKMDPFSDDDEIMELDITKRIRRLLAKKDDDGKPKYEVSEKAVEALSMMLSKNPVGRPKVSELLNLDFFIAF